MWIFDVDLSHQIACRSVIFNKTFGVEVGKSRGAITEPWGTPVNKVYGVQVVQYKGLYTRNNIDIVRIT